MNSKVIYIKNTGINHLNAVYKTSFKYNAHKEVYLKNGQVYNEEKDDIEIYTNISNKQELIDFINEVKKTDIVTMFKSVRLIVNFKTLINSTQNNAFFTMHHITETLVGNKIEKEEYYEVYIHTDLI